MTDERRLLEDLLTKLNEYNAPDMLEGYLDGLGAEFNGRLEELELPTIEQVGESEETVDDLNFTVRHLATDEMYSAGAHNGLDHEQALQALAERLDISRKISEEVDYSNFEFYEGLPTNGQTIADLTPLRPTLLFKMTRILDSLN